MKICARFRLSRGKSTKPQTWGGEQVSGGPPDHSSKMASEETCTMTFQIRMCGCNITIGCGMCMEGLATQRLNFVWLFVLGDFCSYFVRFLLYQCIHVATFLFYMPIFGFICAVLGVTSSISSLHPCFVH